MHFCHVLSIAQFNYTHRAHHRPLLFLIEVERSGFSLATVVDKKKSIKPRFLNKQQLRERRTWLK